MLIELRLTSLADTDEAITLRMTEQDVDRLLIGVHELWGCR
jgi:hypothetical protein